MADINKVANVVSDTNESNGDKIDVNEVSWDKYIALLEDKLQKAAVHDEYEAYRLYCEYAHAMGFSVRKGKSDYFSGSTKMRSKLFTCSKEGLKEIRIDKKGNVLHTKSTERTGCQARIWFTRKIDGPLKVSKWIREHNHEMVGSNQRHLLRSAKSTGLFHENLMESHVEANVHPIVPMAVEDDSMKHACFSQSQHYNSTESEMEWCNRIMRRVHDLIIRSRGNIEARRIVEKALDDAHEKVGVILQKHNGQVQSSKDDTNVSDGPMLDLPFVKSKGVSWTRVQSRYRKRERHRKIIQMAAQRTRYRKKWRKKTLASQDTHVVQHIASSIPSPV